MKFGRTAALFMTLITLVGCRTAAGVSTLPVEPPLPLTLVPVPSATPIRLVYGPDVDNVGELYLPDNDADSVPVVVMVHGGGWLSKPDMTHFRPLAEAVAERGIAVWNIEYRRERNDYKDTLTDIDNAIDILASTAQEAAGGRLDLDRVQVAGHSAGGQLAAWAASRHTLPASAPWAQPRVKPRNATIMLRPRLTHPTSAYGCHHHCHPRRHRQDSIRGSESGLHRSCPVGRRPGGIDHPAGRRAWRLPRSPLDRLVDHRRHHHRARRILAPLLTRPRTLFAECAPALGPERGC